MKYKRIIRSFHNQPLALLPAKLEEIRAFLHAKAAGKRVRREEIAAIMAARRPDGSQMVGRVAVVQVFGTIMQRAGMMDEMSGAVSAEQLGATLDALVADKQVRCVCMVFDSPGGSVFGVQELADKIAGYRGQKKVVGIADSMAASAAYWLGSQCAELWCTPSGQVGSIGVLAAHEDVSKLHEALGVKTTLVSAGKFKTEGNPYEPLGDDARADLQSKVDSYYSAFVEAVARGRSTTAARVKADMGQGRMLTADDAKGAGMVDRVGTLAKLLDSLGAYENGGAKAELAERTITAMGAAARLRVLEVA